MAADGAYRSVTTGEETKQAASATGEGAAAALAIRRHVEPLASGLRPGPAPVAVTASV